MPLALDPAAKLESSQYRRRHGERRARLTPFSGSLQLGRDGEVIGDSWYPFGGFEVPAEEGGTN
ncbi:hypothetical protein [Streptomyces sp. NPDC006463]|uniref:hypothetical protein n=1 Tax=Streptomyces sp. NPDC006463 TaxID=3364746 RepID=UPI0036842EA1